MLLPLLIWSPRHLRDWTRPEHNATICQFLYGLVWYFVCAKTHFNCKDFIVQNSLYPTFLSILKFVDKTIPDKKFTKCNTVERQSVRSETQRTQWSKKTILIHFKTSSYSQKKYICKWAWFSDFHLKWMDICKKNVLWESFTICLLISAVNSDLDLC